MMPQQGLASLPQAQQGPMQGPMPGQAPQQPMPGMMPQQGAPTPGAMTGSLKNMPLEQLRALYQNPQPGNPPLWAVISALAEKQKEAQAMMAAQGQSAMAQNAQMQQQPPVAAQVVQAAEQMREPQAYAGGGAVAFENGGLTFGYAPDYELARKYGINLSPYDAPEVRAEKIKRARAMADFEEQRKSFGEIPTEASVAKDALLQQAYSDQTRSRDVPRSGISALPVAAPTSAPQRSNVVQGQPAFAQRPQTGIAGIMGPQIDPYMLEARDAAAEYQKALQQGATLTPEQIAARQKIDEAMEGRKRFIGTEEQRRESLAEKRLQEALERSRVNPLEDITFIGQMLEGMRGTKRFGEGLAGLASGAGRAQAARQAAVRAAEEKYDLSRTELFKLQDLRSQLDMDQAKLGEARATGDADKINAAAANVAKSKMDLAKFQGDIEDRALGRSLEKRKIDVEAGKIGATLEQTRYAREMSNEQRLMTLLANAEGRKQELARKIADDFREANKSVYTMASIPGGKITPEIAAQKQALDRELALKIRAATADLDKIIAQTAAQIPGFGTLYGTSGGGLPPGVTVEKVGGP